jgi:hypothetical protein
MKMYLTSAAANRGQLLWLRGWLERQGHTVVSSWFDMPVPLPDNTEAAIALIEIDEAAAVVEYVGTDNAISSTSAFEMGYAYRAGKKLYYIGKPSCPFVARYGELWPGVPQPVEWAA